MDEQLSGSSTVGDQGWRQGSVMPPSLFGRVSEATALTVESGVSCAVVLSQDCDVVHPSYSQEPTVEIIRATRIARVDGNFTFAKSSRKLHLDFDQNGTPQPFELSAHERGWVDRRLLEPEKPDPNLKLPEDATRLLARWIARRYRRDSFPDQFVQRLSEKKPNKKLLKLLEKTGEHISGIFVLLNSQEELPPKDDYEVTLWATVPVESFGEEQLRAQLENEFLDELEDILGSFSGIRILDAMVVSEADFSLSDIRNTRKLDYDTLSYRTGEPVADE